MRAPLFITGTDTGVGKTLLAGMLTDFLCRRGVDVAALKPICSGGRADAEVLRRAMGQRMDLDEINPWHFRAPIAPVLAAEREHRAVRLTEVLAFVRKVRRGHALTLVEGAGGLLSPLGVDFDSRDLIVGLDAVPIIVAANRIGVVNQVLLTLAALPVAARRRARVVLMAPARPDAATACNQALLRRSKVLEVHVLPWFGKVSGLVTVTGRPGVARVLSALAGK